MLTEAVETPEPASLFCWMKECKHERAMRACRVVPCMRGEGRPGSTESHRHAHAVPGRCRALHNCACLDCSMLGRFACGQLHDRPRSACRLQSVPAFPAAARSCCYSFLCCPSSRSRPATSCMSQPVGGDATAAHPPVGLQLAAAVVQQCGSKGPCRVVSAWWTIQCLPHSLPRFGAAYGAIRQGRSEMSRGYAKDHSARWAAWPARLLLPAGAASSTQFHLLLFV
jgi:hypothetical protein